MNNKSFFEKYIFFKVFYRMLSYFHTMFNIFIYNLKKIFRILNMVDYKVYNNLKKYKNKYNGKRCFIVATGPSLKIEDIEKLSEEITFSMNSICLIFDKTKWRPTFYCIQDKLAYNNVSSKLGEDLSDFLYKENCMVSIFSDSIKINRKKNDIIYPLNLGVHGSRLDRKFKTKGFSKNAYIDVFDGYTVTYSIMQLAVYMGFKEIYLLGCDTSYSDTKRHFIEFSDKSLSYKNCAEKYIISYEVAKKFCDNFDVKIYNSTRGGDLEVFERVNLDDIL